MSLTDIKGAHISYWYQIDAVSKDNMKLESPAKVKAGAAYPYDVGSKGHIVARS
jgi:hypothetical protein